MARTHSITYFPVRWPTEGTQSNINFLNATTEAELKEGKTNTLAESRF